MTISISSADVWVGDLFPDELEEYVDDTFDDDGEAIASEFRREFSLPWLDHDFVESHSVAERGESIFSVFDGFSFSDSYKNVVLKRCIELAVQKSRSAIICFGLSAAILSPANAVKMQYVGRFQIAQELE